MNESLKYFIESNTPQIEETMFALVEKIEAPANLKDSMLYSLKAGGKRIRPLFVVAVLELYRQHLQDGFTVGAVIEIIHTYSLIHDDLPSMDNDDFRRGKPTNHKVYGEALATLAGDALNTLAFGILARMDIAEKRMELVELLSVAKRSRGHGWRTGA